MEYVEPIREIEKINAMKAILKSASERDLLLFVLGINTGIKISDLLHLTINDVYDGKRIKEFIFLKDEKSGTKQAFYINNSVKKVLKNYLSSANFNTSDYLFKSKKNNLPITRQQAYRILNHAAKEVGIPGKIGTHTLRKTFGYHAYQKGVAISLLMSIFHHHSPGETLRYLGIDKTQKTLVKIDVNL